MSKIILTITHIVAIALGWLLASSFGSCNRIVTPGAFTGKPGKPYLVSARTETDTVEKIVHRDRWRVEYVQGGTVYDTTRTALPSSPYIWRGTAIREADTVDVAYHHPEMFADIELRRGPDTVRTITITNDTVIGIPDSRKWGLGFQAGVGLQRGTDGTVRAGIQIGVGINFNIWEP